MTTLTLKVEDSALENVMWFLEHLKDVVKIDQTDAKNDLLAEELQERIREIDEGTETLTPYSEGMDSMMEKIRLKHASA